MQNILVKLLESNLDIKHPKFWCNYHIDFKLALSDDSINFQILAVIYYFQ